MVINFLEYAKLKIVYHVFFVRISDQLHPGKHFVGYSIQLFSLFWGKTTS